MAAIFDSGLTTKVVRYRSLLNGGNASAPHIQTELADLKRDILGSGVSEKELAERSAPGVNAG